MDRMNVPEAQNEIVARFTELCGDPNDASVAASADRALRALDALLTAEAARSR